MQHIHGGKGKTMNETNKEAYTNQHRLSRADKHKHIYDKLPRSLQPSNPITLVGLMTEPEATLQECESLNKAMFVPMF